MLVLSRKLGESLIIGDNIKITVEEISKGQIKLGIEAPKDVAICREEVYKNTNESPPLKPTSYFCTCKSN
ncbi:MAG: carbon storage regulator CsrA [Planctomycetota bacterium]|jgi:carbon storage regulator